MAHARPSILADAYELAPHLRVEDVAEVKAANGFTPEDALVVGYLGSSPCLSIIHEDRCIGMFGVASSSDPLVGLVWLLASPELPSIKAEFIAQTPGYLAVFHQKYPILSNLVDERNALHIRWLKRVGFTFINRHPHAGVEQRPFLEFVKLCAVPQQSLSPLS